MIKQHQNINIFSLLDEDSSDEEEDFFVKNEENDSTYNNDFLLENIQRSNAFYCLKNKKNISKKLFKTKMCMYVSKSSDDNGNITYINNCIRPNCHFAHSEDELNCAECVFGDTCKFKNSKTRPCTFLHPTETIETFKKRTGLEQPGKQFYIQPIILS
jgi:hypothetical protein